jgi:hypothetical protein
LYKFYNNKHDYPVYVYYFDDIYDSKDWREKVSKNISENIHFISIPYKSPEHIPESEMFYNRKDVQYVRKHFSIKRKGFLHMCNFMCNMYGYENTQYDKYDYIMTLDDESGFRKEMVCDPIAIMASREEQMGALHIYDQHVKLPHQGNFDTRIGLWDFIKSYLSENDIVPKSKFLQDLLLDEDADSNFHYYPIAYSYVMGVEFLQSPEWKHWLKAVNDNGGIYKYRWGDNDIYSLGHLIHYEHPICDFKIVNDGYHESGMFKRRQAIAPGVKDTAR